LWVEGVKRIRWEVGEEGSVMWTIVRGVREGGEGGGGEVEMGETWRGTLGEFRPK